MIEVARFDGKKYYLNPHLIESMECYPDTTITLVGTKKIVVKDSADDILEKIQRYRRSIGISISDIESSAVLEGDTQ